MMWYSDVEIIYLNLQTPNRLFQSDIFRRGRHISSVFLYAISSLFSVHMPFLIIHETRFIVDVLVDAS